MLFGQSTAPLTLLVLLLKTAQFPIAADTYKINGNAVSIGLPAGVEQELGNILQPGLLQRLTDDVITTASENVAYLCLNDTEMIIRDVLEQKKQTYARQFIDADAKIPSGILQGHWAWTGDYQQCISIVSPINNATRQSFKGNYNTVLLYRNGQPFFPPMLPLQLGVCLPDSCSKADVRALMDIVLSPLSEQNITIGAVETDETPSFSGGSMSATVIMGVLIILVICGTLVDILCKPIILNEKKINIASAEKIAELGYSEGHESKGILTKSTENEESTKVGSYKRLHSDNYGTIYSANGANKNIELTSEHTCASNAGMGWNIANDSIKSFSFFNNTKKLLNTSTADGPLACLNGLRVISMWWVIQGHSYEFVSIVLDNSAYYSSTLKSRFTFQAILNGTYSVDSFFFLSGLLVAYMALREWKKRGRMNWVYYFVHRYWRLTPVYALVMLLFTTITTYLISGPYRWLVVSPQGFLYTATNNCHKYWWSNLLYINNLYPDYGRTSGCMGWAWYLANDMQFYVLLSPVIIILLHKNKLVGWLVSTFLILVGIGIRAGLVSLYGLTLMDGGRTKHMDDPWGNDALYVHPWSRFTVYIVGMLTGHILQSTNCKIRLNKFTALVGWCVAAATALSVIYGMHHYNSNDNATMSLVVSGFYNSLNRTAWSLSLAWLTIACASGYGGWVNAILSWKTWAPLGRLTYCAYLLHPIVIVAFYFNAKKPYHFTDLFMISTFVSMTVLTYGISYIMSMIAEAPMMQLEKVLLNALKSNKINTCSLRFTRGFKRLFTNSTSKHKTSFNKSLFSESLS